MATSVVLLDRRDDFRIAYSAALRSAAIHVIPVRDAAAALSASKTSPATVIVVGLDPETRDRDLAWCRRIKADPETSDISILLTIDNKLVDEDVGEDIRQRAFELYERRGREAGHDWDDWFQAEREISAPTPPGTASERRPVGASRRRSDRRAPLPIQS